MDHFELRLTDEQDADLRAYARELGIEPGPLLFRMAGILGLAPVGCQPDTAFAVDPVPDARRLN